MNGPTCRLSRREWLARTALGGSAAWLHHIEPRVSAWQPSDSGVIEARVAHVISEYESQGYHRTATSVDAASGEWLANQVRQIGLAPRLESFPLDRVDLVTNALTVEGTASGRERRIEGIPLFDGAFTDERGIRGRLGPVGSSADIALTDTAINAAGRGVLGDARRSGRHRAIVAITRPRRGQGLCPSNADAFRAPFGPPVLQVSNEHEAWLREAATRGAAVRVTAHVRRTTATADNVTAALDGTDLTLPPFVVMTPRSGWYWCASERGGGIACWLEIMRALHPLEPRRSVLFVASSGHELGHLGIDAFIERRPGLATQAIGWLHLGANIGAAVDPGIALQASHDDLEASLTRALSAVGLAVTQRTPRDRVPSGEAEAVHRRGGRYVSLIGGNGLFHHVDDRSPKAVDPVTIGTCSAALAALVRQEAERA
ncbi:MAG: hypothetical protein FJW27_16815 [Acidimicrobiia bacterium]|nr:hypothetical protein [Acidimicrobiia bacterium]